MRWFAAFIVTALLAALFAGLMMLRNADIPYVSPALTWAIPFPWLPGRIQIALLFGAWLVVRAVLQRVVAYTESAIEASPRAAPGKRASLGAFVYRWFGNPTGRWMAPYATVLGIIVAAAAPLALLGVVPPLAWGLSALYAATLASAMVVPDRAQPLRHAPELAVDPVLDLSQE